MDRLDLLVVQGTLKNLLQHHTSKASILQHSAFFTVQLSHPYTILYLEQFHNSLKSPNYHKEHEKSMVKPRLLPDLHELG